MLGGVLGKRERRGPTHTLLTVLRPPAPKNIAFNWQGGNDFTGPLRTSWSQDRSSSSSWTIFSLMQILFCLQLCSVQVKQVRFDVTVQEGKVQCFTLT